MFYNLGAWSLFFGKMIAELERAYRAFSQTKDAAQIPLKQWEQQQNNEYTTTESPP